MIHVRYWAAAKAAAGTAEDFLDTEVALTLAEVVRRSAELHPGRLVDVLRVCSTLVDDRPTASSDPATLLVHPGQRVEFLPPFAGG